ncbi:MAG: MotA/TolQ/ExbB proton channel family protein [Phycisphaeraceae bacterium]|nr:MAG: MotA/TolQ/ExbB proton channel family protein [Phycisphaeraceae bacterium]
MRRTGVMMMCVLLVLGLLVCGTGDVMAQGVVPPVSEDAGGARLPSGVSSSGVPPAIGGRVSMGEAFFIQRHPETKRVEVLGTMIVWGLLALSAACIGLLGAMSLANRRSVVVAEDRVREVERAVSEGRFREALDLTADPETDAMAVLHAGLNESVHGYNAMLRASEQVGEDLLLRRLRRIEPLNIIGNVAPMIGLFGTVYGMILAFREIVAAGGSPDPVSLAAGIGTALTTTFWGLVVAIPALAGYALLRNVIDAHAVESSRLAESVLVHFRPSSKKPSQGGADGDGAKRERAEREPDHAR